MIQSEPPQLHFENQTAYDQTKLRYRYTWLWFSRLKLNPKMKQGIARNRLMSSSRCNRQNLHNGDRSLPRFHPPSIIVWWDQLFQLTSVRRKPAKPESQDDSAINLSRLYLALTFLSKTLLSFLWKEKTTETARPFLKLCAPVVQHT